MFKNISFLATFFFASAIFSADTPPSDRAESISAAGIVPFLSSSEIAKLTSIYPTGCRPWLHGSMGVACDVCQRHHRAAYEYYRSIASASAVAAKPQ